MEALDPYGGPHTSGAHLEDTQKDTIRGGTGPVGYSLVSESGRVGTCFSVP